jgi:hypothetical protein
VILKSAKRLQILESVKTAKESSYGVKKGLSDTLDSATFCA